MGEYVYRQYCDHGQPIYYKGCSGCKAVKAHEANIRYESYWAKRRAFFWDHLKQMFEGDVRDPAYTHRLPQQFNTLRKSNSFEELRHEYRKLARKHHPDKGGTTDVFQRLQNLYERLIKRFQ